MLTAAASFVVVIAIIETNSKCLKCEKWLRRMIDQVNQMLVFQAAQTIYRISSSGLDCIWFGTKRAYTFLITALLGQYHAR